jgi:hypothetical protein
LTEQERLASELEKARADAAYWEREAVLRAVAVAGALFDQVALARALARNVEGFLDGAHSRNQVVRALDAFWRAADARPPGTESPSAQ